MIERDRMGGDCTNTGCIPSKSLLHESAIRGGVGEDRASVLAEVRARRDALRDHEVTEFGGAEGVTFVYGTASVGSDRRVSIARPDGTTWTATADDIILATGSSPRRLPIRGAESAYPVGPLVTNDELFELTEVPTHLAVIGGGAIGLEMALAFPTPGLDGHGRRTRRPGAARGAARGGVVGRRRPVRGRGDDPGRHASGRLSSRGRFPPTGSSRRSSSHQWRVRGDSRCRPDPDGGRAGSEH